MILDKSTAFLSSKYLQLVIFVALTFSIAKFEDRVFVSKVMLSDFLFPILFFILLLNKDFKDCLISLFKNTSFRKFSLAYTMLFVTMVFSLLNSYTNLGYIPSWASSNRIVGFVIMGIYTLFTICMLNFIEVKNWFIKYVKFFFICNLLLLIFYIVFGNLYYLLDMKCFSGFSRNSTSNGFMTCFLLVALLLFKETEFPQENKKNTKNLFVIVAFFVFMALATNSRVILIVLPIIFLVLLPFLTNNVSLFVSCLLAVLCWLVYREFNSPKLVTYLFELVRNSGELFFSALKWIEESLDKFLLNHAISINSGVSESIKNSGVSESIKNSGVSESIKNSFSDYLRNIQVNLDFSYVKYQTREISLIDESSEIRLKMYQIAINNFFESPVFGKGLGYFISTNNFGTEGKLVVHNTLLWVASEMGLIGLFFFVLFLYTCFVPHLILFHKDKLIFAVIVAGLAVFFIYSMFHEVFYQRVFWIFIGCLWYKSIKQNYVCSAK